MNKSRKQHPYRCSLYKTIFQIRYKPQLKFFQLMITAAQEFGEYPHWQLEDSSSVVLRDFEKRCSLAIRHNQFSFDQDSGEEEYQKKYIEKAIERLPKSLDINSYLRLGFRRHYLMSTQMTFDELVAILDLKLLSQEERLRKLMPPKFDDLMYRVDSSDGDIKFHITVGPVQKKEIPRYIGFTQAHHLDPQTREKDYQIVVDSYPDIAVFVDIDIYKVADVIQPDEAFNFLEYSLGRIDSMVLELRDYLFAKEL